MGWSVDKDSLKVATDGRPYVDTKSGEKQFLETAAPIGAVHLNPGFEDETLGFPDYWDLTWRIGLPVVSSDTSLVYSGDASCKVVLPAGGTEQLVISDTFNVASGDRLDFSTFALKTAGSPSIQLGLITGSSGIPIPLDPGNYTFNENSKTGLGIDWNMYQRTSIVPAGHTKARLFFRIAPATTETCTAYLDLTASTLTAAAEYDSGWLAPSFSNGWGNFGAPYSNIGYRKTGDFLHLQGMCSGGTTTVGTTMFTLPAGFRPSAQKRQGAAGAVTSGAASAGTAHTHNMLTSAQFDILTTGEVKIASGNNGYMSFDGVAFWLT